MKNTGTSSERKIIFKLTKAEWASMRNDEIAAQHDCTPHTVYKYRRAHKLPPPPRKPGSGAKPRIRLSQINLKLSAAENARKLDCSENWMYSLMRKKRAGAAPAKKESAWE